MWISFRQNTEDDFAWETPMNLGCTVNSEWDDACPFLFEDEEIGSTTLYFVSNRPDGIGIMNVYESTVDANGSFGQPILVEEVSSSEQDLHFAPRRDGLEAFIWSTRLGGFGLGDIWVSTRESTADAWSTPVNLGPMNVTGTSNEPADPGPDIVISGSGLDPYMVQLRAERLGAGTGRIYTLTATATDLAGNTATTTATCVVPHDQGHWELR